MISFPVVTLSTLAKTAKQETPSAHAAERKGPLASVVAALCWRSQAAFCSALPKSCSERLGYVLDECHSDVRGRAAYTPHAQILLFRAASACLVHELYVSRHCPSL